MCFTSLTWSCENIEKLNNVTEYVAEHTITAVNAMNRTHGCMHYRLFGKRVLFSYDIMKPSPPSNRVSRSILFVMIRPEENFKFIFCKKKKN